MIQCKGETIVMKERGELLKQYPGIDKGWGLGHTERTWVYLKAWGVHL